METPYVQHHLDEQNTWPHGGREKGGEKKKKKLFND